jgi:hypothetical protein
MPVGGPTWPAPFTRTRLIDTADDVTSSSIGVSLVLDSGAQLGI